MRLLRGIFALTLVAAFLLAIGITPNTALADTVTVTNCTPSGLEQAIAAAGENGLVQFNCGNPEIEFTSWADQITIDTTVTIDGSNGGINGENQIVLDGHNATNFFVIETGGNVTVRNMTFWGGNTYNTDVYDGNERVFESTNEGGAIDIEDEGSLTVIASTFFDNYADGYGGAIDSNGSGTLTVRGSTFVGNESGQYGGAIESWGTLVISQSSFINNSVPIGAGSFTLGGAIDVYTGTVKINSSTFSGNFAARGSAINVDDRDSDQTPAMISWSTIVQPTGAVPAIYFDSPVTLTGVILGGEGAHCEFDGFNGTLADSYTLTNDNSCGLIGTGSVEVSYADGFINLGLGSFASINIDGVSQQHYQLLEGSPAIDGGPASCDTDIQPGPDSDQIGRLRPVGDCDIGAIEYGTMGPPNTPGVTSALCANQWNGALRMIDDDGECGRSESLILLPDDGSIDLCVDQWNGSATMDDSCGRGEYELTAIGDGSIDVCVNKWNGTLRVSDRCGRSEYADVI